MIIVSLSGGLGNQMFQHAAGLALAQVHSSELLWDLSAYQQGRSQWNFELTRVFGLTTALAGESALQRVLGWRGHPAWRQILDRQRFAWIRPDSHIVEPHFHYWPEFASLWGDVYLSGYWQSEKYFQAFRKLVRDTYTFFEPLSSPNQTLADAMESCNSVSIHVRRGDYVTNASANRVHGSCAPDYYRAAERVVLDRVGHAHFFIFSDDPEWVRHNLQWSAPCTYVEHNHGASSYCDMQLMSICRHHIIANSSFSWWGAWLGPTTDGMVVAPRRWFADTRIDSRDLYCQGWLLI